MPLAVPGTCLCSAASARPVTACATIAGRPVLGGLDAIPGEQAGGVRPPPPPAALTRCRVVRGGGVMRCLLDEILDDMKSEDWGTLTIGRNWQIVRIIGPSR